MPISGSAVWEVRATADAGNVGGGFFVTGASGDDFSQQNSPEYALTGVTSAGAGNVILHASAAADMVGNGIKVISGTNFTVSWFEITAVTVGVDITCSTNAAGTAISTGVGADGVMNIGGAISLNTSGASGDDDVFKAGSTTDQWWFKNDGTITIAETVTMTPNGTTINPRKFYGYNATRGDNPTGATRPTIDCGAFIVTFGQASQIRFINFTGTVSQLVNPNANSRSQNCKVTNTSVTAARTAMAVGAVTERCELISYRGIGVSNAGGGTSKLINNYFHDSNIGFNHSGSAAHVLIGNIFADCVTAAANCTSATLNGEVLRNNTFYGAENKLGEGINFSSGAVMQEIVGNIFYGFVTGVDSQDAVNSIYEDYNTYYNNTTDRNNCTAGPGTIAVNPAFANVTQLTGTGATSLTNVLTVGSGTPFGSVVDNQDFVYLVSGTGTGFGAFKYLITAHTTTELTLSSNITSSGAGTNIVWQVTLGHNFSPTGAI